jgi:hypothetical protein
VFWIRLDCHWRDRDFPWLSILFRWIPEKYFTIDPDRVFQNPHQQIIHHLLLSHLILGYTTLKRHNWLTWKSINQDSVYFWWGTSQTEYPDHVPVYILATKEYLRRFMPYTWRDERNTQRIWRIVQILWEPDYSDRQAGELQCSVINRMAYVADSGRGRRGACLWQERFTVSDRVLSAHFEEKKHFGFMALFMDITLHTLRHCSWISHTSHLTALFMDITHFTPYDTVLEYHTLRHCSWISHTSLHTAQTCLNILVTSRFKPVFLHHYDAFH